METPTALPVRRSRKQGGSDRLRKHTPRANALKRPFGRLCAVADSPGLKIQSFVDEDLRKIELWTARHGNATADWSAEPVDPFFNVNTPEDAA